jgi:UrcA family protein
MTVRTFVVAAALAIVAPSAFAAPQSVSVNYDDLDLSTPQGMAQLDKRIDRAAKQVCTTREVTTGTIVSSPVDQDCYRQTLDKMKTQLAAITGHQRQG